MRELAGRYGLRLVVLFGSQARGSARPKSDYDIAVLTSEGYAARRAPLALAQARRLRTLHAELQRLLGTGRVDLVVLDRASALLSHRVAREGIPLFEESGGEFARFCVRSLQRMDDARGLMEAERRFLSRRFGTAPDHDAGTLGRQPSGGKALIDADVVRRKIRKLEQYLRQLQEARPPSLKTYLESWQTRRVVERLIQLIVEVANDINTHMIVELGHPPPDDYFEGFTRMGELGVLPADLAARLAPSAGERNILVHEYELIDDTIVYESIADALQNYTLYGKALLEYVEKLDKGTRGS